jgi:hypothetical protein
MFSLLIVDSDAFLDMPQSSQLLYFHLSMRGDDDGFVSSPKKIIRMIGACENDLSILLSKRFLLNFESGVVVIKHWRINNYIQKDRYSETKYLEEKGKLVVKENGSYTECIQKVSKVDTQVRLGKVRLGKNTSAKGEAKQSSSGASEDKNVQNVLNIGKIIKAFEEVDPKNKTYYANTTQRKAAQFLIDEYGIDPVLKVISILSKTNKVPFLPRINSPFDLKEKYVRLRDAMIAKEQELTINQQPTWKKWD